MDLPSYIADALAFSSGRRLAFVRVYRELVKEVGVDPPSKGGLLGALEAIHCSATIVDDMLDNEAIRRDLPTYYRRHGPAIAAFASLNLMVKAIEIIHVETTDLSCVLSNIRQMIVAEEADVGLSKRPKELDPLEWYQGVVSKKIVGELLLILDLCLSHSVAAETRRELRNMSSLLGQFIQYCDDRLDLLVRNPLLSQEKNNRYVLTFSLPLAIYMHANDNRFESVVGVGIPRSLVSEIVDAIRSAENIVRVDAFIMVKHQELTASIRKLGLRTERSFLEICETAWTSAYEEEVHEVA